MFGGLRPGAGHEKRLYRSLAVVAAIGILGLFLYWMVA